MKGLIADPPAKTSLPTGYIWNGYVQEPSGPHALANIGKHPEWILHMLQHMIHNDEIITRVGR
jgi:hypothetical protein